MVSKHSSEQCVVQGGEGGVGRGSKGRMASSGQQPYIETYYTNAYFSYSVLW